MISRIYISHVESDEGLAEELSQALWRVGLESCYAMHSLDLGITRSERVSFGIRSSDCLVAILTSDGSISRTVNQEIGFARGIDHLVFPMVEIGLDLPFLIEHLKPINFTRDTYSGAVYLLIKTIRQLSRLDWLKIICPKCGEEMTQYLTPQEDVDLALADGSFLETICSYCQNSISLDPRTFGPVP